MSILSINLTGLDATDGIDVLESQNISQPSSIKKENSYNNFKLQML